MQIRTYTRNFDYEETYTMTGFEFDSSASSLDVCQDTANGALDSYNDGCSYYFGYEEFCQIYDDADFRSNEMCCVCRQTCND